MASGGGSAPSVGRTMWDLLTVIVVVIFLGVMTWYLVKHFGSDANKAGTILGIITPVLGAIFGISIGYSAGNVSGQAQGATKTAQKIRTDLGAQLNTLANSTGEVVSTIQQQGESPTGAATVRLGSAEIPTARLQDLTSTVDSVRSYLNAL